MIRGSASALSHALSRDSVSRSDRRGVRAGVHHAPDLVIGFSILSGLLSYTFMSINMSRLRKLGPLGSIGSGYTHLFHPITAIVLVVLCVAVYFATYLGYTKMLLSIMVFYILASL